MSAVDISALTLLVVCWEGHPARRTRRATYPQRFSSGTSGGRKTTRGSWQIQVHLETAVKRIVWSFFEAGWIIVVSQIALVTALVTVE